MSILIKGMEIPKSCFFGLCPLRKSCIHSNYADRRPDNCPLVEVPPHGDLKDTDVLKEKIWQARVWYQMLDDTQTADKIMRGIYLVEQILDEVPTIIQAEGSE